MDENLPRCLACERHPVHFCVKCLKQYCAQHKDHVRLCGRLVHSTLGQTGADYSDWLSKCTQYEQLTIHRMYRQAIEQLSVLRLHVKEHFHKAQVYSALQTLDLHEFLIMSTVGDYQQCNKYLTQHEYLRAVPQVADLLQYQAFLAGRQLLSNSKSVFSQLNVANFCIYNQQLATSHIAFQSVRPVRAHYYLMSLARQAQAFPTNQQYRCTLERLAKQVDFSVSKYFSDVNFNRFDEYDQCLFLMLVDLLIWLLREGLCHVAQAHRVYTLFDELQYKLKATRVVETLADYLIIQLGISCCKISGIDALDALQKKKVMEQLDAVVSRLGTGCQADGRACSDIICYIAHPVYKFIQVVNSEENVAAQARAYVARLRKDSEMARITRQVSSVFGDSIAQRSLLAATTRREDRDRNEGKRADAAGDMSMRDLSTTMSRYDQLLAAQESVYTSRPSMACSTIVEANKAYLASKHEQNAALMRQSALLLQQCDEVNQQLRSLLHVPQMGD